MAKLLMNDETHYNAQFHPTHVVGKDKELINVYVGTSTSLMGGFGLYVADDDWDKLNHEKAYIFIHNPDAVSGDIEAVDWDQVDDVEDTDKRTEREHIHLWN